MSRCGKEYLTRMKLVDEIENKLKEIEIDLERLKRGNCQKTRNSIHDKCLEISKSVVGR